MDGFSSIFQPSPLELSLNLILFRNGTECINSFSSENCRDEIVCDDSVNLVEDEEIKF